VLLLCLALAKPIWGTYWPTGFKLFSAGILGIVIWVLQSEYEPTLAQFGLDASTLASMRVKAWILVGMGLNILVHTVVFESLPRISQRWFAHSQGSWAEPSLLITAGNLLSVALVGPVFEEVVFRGYLYLVLRQNWGDVPATVITAAAFSLFHWTLNPFLILSSLLYIYLNNRAGSLLPSVAGHVSWNTLVVLREGV
jgi:membrane protease YdiL (CAAX protease family)